MAKPFYNSEINGKYSCFLWRRLDNKSAGRQSVGSNLIKPDDEVDDADSMAAYGEGDTGK